ncbi:MAG: acyl-CoA dehydrogenase [Candidatus Schekmanbacteria bacterium RBG_13_48_7]|uniref:Acyl-CoA dehydrogenase n=1 Tax=Candidatus Schekmanbacteria bacterium RBG_13_48_7 TaxID=1817878 RepID=A0A1F7RWL3_9BACT|nr:MAG: acyl-CoA dehydrogenase [Candidatus Schekmanbacteria bacterium RBG_13_48_7]
MDYFFTEEQKQLQALVRKIAEEKVKPVRAEYDITGEFPWDCIKEFSKAGLFQLFIEEKYGGVSAGSVETCIAMEELSRVCAGIAICYGASGLGIYPIILFGNEEQKEKYLPPFARGEKLAAFGLTEPGAGSDAAAQQTTAVRDGNEYILNGTKQWITNGGEAEIYTVFAMTDKSKGVRGISAFIVEKGTPGFSFGKKADKMGIRASVTRELIFEDCRIPVENIIAKEGHGFRVAMATLDHTRPEIGAQALGIAQGAFDEALKYSRVREQFGQPLSSFQGLQFMFAEIATHIEATRALVYSVARFIDGGAKNFTKEGAMVKLFSSEMAMKVTTDCVQLLGGYGYMKDYPLEKMMRDAKITQIYEGTNQIQRNVIALRLIKELAGG